MLQACLDNPGVCTSFETWGFTDRHSSLGPKGIAPPGAFFYDGAYVAKPARQAVAEALGERTRAVEAAE